LQNRANHVFSNIDHKWDQIYGNQILTNETLQMQALQEFAEAATRNVPNNYKKGVRFTFQFKGRTVQATGNLSDSIFQFGNGWIID